MENQGQCLTPFQRKLLLKSLQTNLRPEYRRRLEIMLLADTGQSQAQICKALGCSQEMARYWIVMAQTGNAHHWNDCPMGRPKTVNEPYLARLKELVSHSPREYGYPFQRWTAQWLRKHLAKELGIKVSDSHINRLLKQMGLSTRPEPATALEVMNHTNTTIPTSTDLNVRLSDLEVVGDIGYAVTSLSELELLDDISVDSETIADVGEQGDIADDSGVIAKLESSPLPVAPLTQSALARRLGCSDKAIEKHRKQGSKEQFATWSGERDPNSITWTWEGSGGRGQPLRFVPT